MSILINKDTKVICQGFTGKNATLNSKKAITYGTKLIGGITPGKGGSTHLNLPIFDSVEEAVSITKATASVIYVPAPFAADAILEAIYANVSIIICITEGIPIYDMLKIKNVLSYYKHVKLIGPNSPGIISPNFCNIGVIPANIYRNGSVGIVSRSGTLAYEAAYQITHLGLGQSTCVGIGGDPIHGISFVEVLEMFLDDPETSIIVMIGEIGGNAEIQAVEYVRKTKFYKPIVGFIAGQTAPKTCLMGHAGAIISTVNDTAQSKIEAMRTANINMVSSIEEIGKKVFDIEYS